MRDHISVRDVLEHNDCAGKKHIHVTAMESDELIKSQFRMSRVYMIPHEKLMLANVSPMDIVKIRVDDHSDHPLVVGDFVEVCADGFILHTPTCRCHTELVSDGFDVYCPNLHCGLTLSAQIQRLGNTVFFPPEQMTFDLQKGFLEPQVLTLSDNPVVHKPFASLLDLTFWGKLSPSRLTLEDILLNPRHIGPVSIATFLIEDLFLEFLEKNNPQVTLEHLKYSNIFRFYGDMRELINRRDYGSISQNHLLKEFLWSLGLECLQEPLIHQMMHVEQSYGLTDDVMLPYAYMLTHPQELVNELGLHKLEAQAIIREVRRRAYELHDIFSHYSNDNADVRKCFHDVLR